MKLNIESQVHFQRFILGIICGLLPIGCVAFGIFGADTALLGDSWWHSISATYFSNSQVWMVGSLVLASFFFATYKGHDWGDRILTIVSSLSALSVAIFPCENTAFDRCGLFMLPTKISGLVHNISAAVLFLSFAVMILTQFTKGQSKARNRVYLICGNIILHAMASQVATTIFDVPWMTIINEFVMLEAFAVAWLVKSRVVIKKTEKCQDGKISN